MKQCTVTGCRKLVVSKGLCHSHYRKQIDKPPCSIDGCDTKQHAKSFCMRHYLHNRMYGDPLYYCYSSTNVIEKEEYVFSKSSDVDIPPYRRTEYQSWRNMLLRCYDKNNSRYDRYGGRGIKVCDNWKSNFLNFFDDMGEKPTPRHTLDRIDNDGNYEPTNCRWATVRQQNNNRSISARNPGVNFIKSSGIWVAALKIGKTWVYRKYFKTEQEAIAARQEAERIYLQNVER